MAQQVGDYVVERLREWGVRQVFGYPGDGINGLVAALGRAEDDGPAFVHGHVGVACDGWCTEIR